LGRNRPVVEKGSTFQQQAAILVAASLIVRFIGFLYRIPMTAIIGDEGNAYYSVGFQIYNFFLILSSAGLPAAIAKMVSERAALRQYKEAHAVFQTALIVASAIGLFGSLALALFARPIAEMTKYPESYYSILSLSPTLSIVALMAVIRGYFQGMRNTVPTAVSQVAEQIFNGIFTVVLAYAFIRNGVEYAAAGGTAGTGIGALAGLGVVLYIYFMMAPRIKEKMNGPVNSAAPVTGKPQLASELMRTAFPIIIGMAVYSITNLIDTFMVSSRLASSGAFDQTQIASLFGQYAGKYGTITTLPVSISSAMAAAAVPNIASEYKLKDYGAVHNKINIGLRLAMLISVPSAVGLGVLGVPIIKMLFRSYPEGGGLLQAGAISVVFLALTQIATGMLQGIGRINIPVLGAGAGAIMKIAFNFFLIAIPSVNIYGAVISTIICYVTAAGVNVYFLVKHTKVRIDVSRAFLKPAVSSVIMGMVCYVVYYTFFFITDSNGISLIFALIAGVLFYFVIMSVLRGIKQDDVERLPFGNRIVAFTKVFKI